MKPEMTVMMLNALLLGSIAVIHWASVKYGTEYSRLPGFARKLNALLLLWLTLIDLAYYLHSGVLTLLSSIFWIVLLIFVFKNQEVLRERFEVDSRKSCKNITMRALLGRRSYSCLIELARRTSVDFAIIVWFLLIVFILVPIFSVLLYAFFWEEGFLYVVSFMEILGYSVTLAVLALLPTAYLLRRNLVKMMARELSESQLS